MCTGDRHDTFTRTELPWWGGATLFPLPAGQIKRASLVLTVVATCQGKHFILWCQTPGCSFYVIGGLKAICWHKFPQVINSMCQECSEKSIHGISIDEKSSFRRLAVTMIHSSQRIYWAFFFFMDWADNSLCQNIKLHCNTLYNCFQIHFKKEINYRGSSKTRIFFFFAKLSLAVTRTIHNCVAVEDAHQHLPPDIMCSTRYRAARYLGGGGGRIPHPTPLTPPARHRGLGSFMPHPNSSSSGSDGGGGAPWPLRASLVRTEPGTHTLEPSRDTTRTTHTKAGGNNAFVNGKETEENFIAGTRAGRRLEVFLTRTRQPSGKTDRSSHR